MVTRAEWVGNMLVRLGHVDELTVDKINARFDQLDVDKSGTISVNDLLPSPKPTTHNVGGADGNSNGTG